MEPGVRRLSFFDLSKDPGFRQTITEALRGISSQPLDTDWKESTLTTPTLCRLCNVTFSDSSSFRNHYKSDEHVINLKRRALSSVSVSDEDNTPVSVSIASLKGEPLRIWVRSHSESSSCYHGFYKTMVTRRDAGRNETVNVKGLSEIISLGKNVQYAVLLVTAGHFAGAVFKGDQPIAHKAFHRYVVRAKQGSVQSKRDGSGGRIHSAGSSIRRHNEFAFTRDIQELLASWSNEYFAASCSIFIHSPHRMSGIFFDKSTGALRHVAEKIRNIPFNLGRPTFDLVKEVASNLYTVCIVDSTDFERLTAHGHANEDIPDDNSEVSNVNNVELLDFWTAVEVDSEENHDQSVETFCQQFSEQSLADIAEKPELEISSKIIATNIMSSSERIFDELYTYCRSLDSTRLNAAMQTYADNSLIDLLNRPFGIRKETLLHFASRTPLAAEVVKALLAAGCDPAIKDGLGKVPFEVASDDSTRDVFRQMRETSPDKYNWSLSKVSTPSTAAPSSSAPKKKKPKKRKQSTDKSSETSKTESVLSNENAEQKERESFLKLPDEQKRSVRGVRRCFMCGKIVDQGASFDYLYFKFCSVPCLRSHRHQRKDL